VVRDLPVRPHMTLDFQARRVHDYDFLIKRWISLAREIGLKAQAYATTEERVLHRIIDHFQNRHPVRENWTINKVVTSKTGWLAIDLHILKSQRLCDSASFGFSKAHQSDSGRTRSRPDLDT
jgi:hypothetical protein